MLRAARSFESLGGRVVFIDEVLRKVVVNIKASAIDGVERILSEYASSYTVNVKASCFVESPGVVEDRVRGLRGIRVGADIYYASVGGRVVEVHFRGGRRVDVKIGVRSSLVTPVPPSTFNMDLEGARDVLAELPEVLGLLGLGGGGLG